jgi:type IV pilus assembly protein PilE
MSKHRGFSLTELMITIAIVGMLMAIAYPGYSNHVRKTRRNLAAACLQENAQFLERWYTSNLTYVGADPRACPPEIEAFYRVDFEDDALAARTFTITAEPLGAQEKDRCGTLSLDERGVRGATGASVDECW